MWSTWCMHPYTTETLCIVLATLAVGLVGVSGRTMRTWLVMPAAVLYPLSLLFVVVLDYVVGLK